MKNLWAPWRMEVVCQPKTGCFFCEYTRQQNDKQNLIIERAAECFVIMNRFPYSNGHLMIVPYQHTGDLTSLQCSTRASLMEYTAKWQAILQETIRAQGFNIGMNLGAVAGAGVADHLHIHLVPRWLGDTNFMPVLTDTKVINQSLQELYDQLTAKIEPGS